MNLYIKRNIPGRRARARRALAIQAAAWLALDIAIAWYLIA